MQASISLNPDVLERSTVIFRPLRVIQSVPLRYMSGFMNTVLKKLLPAKASFFSRQTRVYFQFFQSVNYSFEQIILLDCYQILMIIIILNSNNNNSYYYCCWHSMLRCEREKYYKHGNKARENPNVNYFGR